MKKTLIIVLCVVMAFALIACSSSSDAKTLEDIVSQDQLDALSELLNSQGDGTYYVEVGIDGNSMVMDYCYGEDSGIVYNDALDEYFNSDAVSEALEVACQQAVEQLSAKDDFANSGIESVNFCITYYDSEGTEMFTKDIDVAVE